MSAHAIRTRGAVPTRFSALAAAFVLLAAPIPMGAQGSSRTVLLSLSDSTSLTALTERIGDLGGRVLESMDIARAMLVELPTNAAVPAGAVEVPNAPLRVNGTRTYYRTQVNTYRETLGASDRANGAGVTVALVDTGIGGNDGMGHGTFLAGLIRGVAPSAEIIDVKVADADGNTSLAQVLRGLQDAAEAKVDVLNISLSTGSPLPPTFDPLTRALDALWRNGTTVVTAAGNEGPETNTTSSPGNDPVLLSVGSVDEAATGSRADDTVAEFSSRGTNFGATKPDIVAPGVSLISDAAPGSIAKASAEASDSLVGDTQMRGSGTSMSAAVASGAAAAVLSVNPGLTPDAVKGLFMDTAYRNANLKKSDGAGAGGLDLGAALAAAPTATSDRAHGRSDEAPGEWGPSEADAQTWATFSTAWEAGDLEVVRAQWQQLSWDTKQWASRAFALATLYAGLQLDEAEFTARQDSSHQWSFDAWVARQWSARQWSARQWSDFLWEARQWSARQWSDEEWAARQWSARQWSARQWSARQWSDEEWLTSAWTARQWSDQDWAARQWSARQWSARQWSAAQWSDHVWEARQWSARQWSARQWAAIA